MFPVSYFLSNRFAGSSSFVCRRTGTAGYPRSRAWYCWRCGEVWARMIMAGGQSWEFHRSLCPKCPYILSEQSAVTLGLHPGSIWPEFGVDTDLIDSFPEEVLRQELGLHLKTVNFNPQSPVNIE